MQIQSGKLYENRTWKYLFPCLKYYGPELMTKLSSFFKLAVGVNDYNKKENQVCIYILVDTNIAIASDVERAEYKHKFSQFLDWLSYKPYFVSEYIYGKNMHMIVLKLPSVYENTYLNFIRGKYSKMYTSKTINEYFKYRTISNKEIEQKQNDKLKIIRNVLKKEKTYIKNFVDIVNKDFKTEITVEDYKDAELDYPPNKKEEIFNYREEEAMAS